MNRFSWAGALVAGGLALAVACGDDPTGVDDPCREGVEFTLNVTGDASYQGPHAGQTMHFRMTCVGGGADSPRGGGSGPIFSPPAPTSFQFGSSVREGNSYEIAIWIDSNFGGGTVGVCDPPSIDHQWLHEIPTITGDLDTILTHDPATLTSVCSRFEELP